jgi:mannose-6-phosphate isomerase-like protein (cupin superfamily)
LDDPIIIFDAEAPVEIHGGEGGSGPLFWKRLVGGVDLDGDWESFEYARVAVGGVIGEHVHWRTEEIYYVTAGRAEMHLDGKPHTVGPGDLIITPIDGKHRARTLGDEDFEFIVAEVLPPESLDPKFKGSHSSPRKPCAVLKLGDGKAIDPTEYFAGPWQSIQLRKLGASERAEFNGSTAEHAFFAVTGSGTARSGRRSIPLSAGRGLAVPKGGHVTVEAGSEGLDLILVSVRLNGARH